MTLQDVDIDDEYKVIHKQLIEPVFNEMCHEVYTRAYDNSFVYCNNDHCERDISKWYAVESQIIGETYYFCAESCCDRGEWSIRYDYKKSQRRRLAGHI
jgi:hypothetical protein